MAEKVTGYKSKFGKIFDTEEEAKIDDARFYLTELLIIKPYPMYGYSLGHIVETLLENKYKVVDILNNI